MRGSGHDVFLQAESAFRAVLADLPPSSPYSPLHRYAGAHIGAAEGEGLWNWLLAKAHQLADEYRRRLDASCSARGLRDAASETRMRSFFEARARRARPYLDALISEHNGQAPSAPPAPKNRRPRKPPRLDRKQESRDRWIYQQCCKGRGVPYCQIIAGLARTAKGEGWEVIDTVQGIRAAAKRYAERHNKAPIPNRQEL